jgi:hypothetical protein
MTPSPTRDFVTQAFCPPLEAWCCGCPPLLRGGSGPRIPKRPPAAGVFVRFLVLRVPHTSFLRVGPVCSQGALTLFVGERPWGLSQRRLALTCPEFRGSSEGASARHLWSRRLQVRPVLVGQSARCCRGALGLSTSGFEPCSGALQAGIDNCHPEARFLRRRISPTLLVLRVPHPF